MARVIALLAHAPGLANGDTAHGMELNVCLTPQGHADLAAYRADPLPWRVRRYWPHRGDWWGQLIEVEEWGWGLRAEVDPDEPQWEFVLGRMRPGEYVTLRRPNGDELVFRIVQVEEG